MEADEFVKKHGWEYAKHILTDDAPLVLDLNYTDLKRLVESYELVEKCGGLEDAKNHLDGIRFNIATKTWFGRALLNWSMYANKLEESIADVESCL